jgi:RNA polymerase I-specific transcription initiation factor RRN11
MNHQFLFASLDSKKPSTARMVHIRRVYDILQLSLQRGDLSRARKAWCILARCKEFDWKSMWTLGVHLVDMQRGQDHLDPNPTRIAFLQSLMLQHPDQVRAFCLCSITTPSHLVEGRNTP